MPPALSVRRLTPDLDEGALAFPAAWRVPTREERERRTPAVNRALREVARGPRGPVVELP